MTDRERRAPWRGCRSRSLGAAAGLLAAAATVVLLGAVDVVVTSGVSMNPAYHEGDLVVVAPADSYDVGQVVAYRDRVHDLVVLHRIIGGGPAGYVLQGDNNASVDAVHPTRADVIGRAVLHVPGAGTWLRRLVPPVAIGLSAVLLLAGGTRVRRRRRHPMATRDPRTLSRPLRVAAGGTAALGVLGVALGAVTWSRPVDRPAPMTQHNTRAMTFSYDAAVRRTAAYDGTTVRAPDPVFRKLADDVDVRFHYEGAAGSLTVAAELSTPNGWRSTVPLASAGAVTTSGYDGTVRLDLAAIERRARAAAAVTGLPAGEVSVAVVPRVTTGDGLTFAPALRLTLTPLRLALAGEPATLTVRDAVTATSTGRAPRTLTSFGRQLPVTTGRTAAAALLLVALVGGAGVGLVARLTKPVGEGAAIRRRYGALLLPVHPMAAPPGHRVVDVTTFAALATLAGRYGLAVLHWSRAGVETFVVQDADTTYRYRADAPTPGPTAPYGASLSRAWQ